MIIGSYQGTNAYTVKLLSGYITNLSVLKTIKYQTSVNISASPAALAMPNYTWIIIAVVIVVILVVLAVIFLMRNLRKKVELKNGKNQQKKNMKKKRKKF